MRIMLLIGLLLLSNTSVFAISCDTSKQLFMPDAQLKTHLVRVYLTQKIDSAMRPKLHLINKSSRFKPNQTGAQFYTPLHLANDQVWEQQVSGHNMTCQGTILLFDLQNYPIPWYKAMSRLTPVLIWNEASATNKVHSVSTIGSKEVYLGNLPGALMWTLLIMGSLIFCIVLFVRQSHGNILLLISQTNNRLSLAKAQISAWTIAVGGVIIGFGLIRLEVPDIPESVLALMGLSLATGGVSFYNKQNPEADLVNAEKIAKIRPKLKDLILIYDAQGANPQPSIARAQMVFWTGLVLILFVSKSILDGVLWQVPWEMVVLMGMSQASYLSPKLFLDGQDDNASQVKKTDKEESE